MNRSAFRVCSWALVVGLLAACGGHEVTVPPAVDAGPRCAPRVSGDTRWAQYAMPGTAGHPRRYEIAGTRSQETVIDCVTGLEWQRSVEHFGYTEQAFAVELCGVLTYAGYTDWRLPSRIELVTLVDYSVAAPGPTIDVTAFPETLGVAFWAASPGAILPHTGSAISFRDGSGGNYGTTTSLPWRCVR